MLIFSRGQGQHVCQWHQWALLQGRTCPMCEAVKEHDEKLAVLEEKLARLSAEIEHLQENLYANRD